ncbi:MAG: YceI family protein [Candidatus Saccharibacteria bacterium]|nr:YceI family protein [Candidatus Saccharibacteria bacterium]
MFSAHRERDKHVRDGDFLDADAHPEIRFVATGYEPQGEDRGELRGDLTLLGETRPVTLDVRINRMGEYPFGGGLFSDPPYVIGISAETTIQRSEWGMTYGVENDIVGDAVDLRLNSRRGGRKRIDPGGRRRDVVTDRIRPRSVRLRLDAMPGMRAFAFGENAPTR